MVRSDKNEGEPHTVSFRQENSKRVGGRLGGRHSSAATTAIDCGQGNNVAVYRLQVDSLLFSKEVEVIGQYGAEIVDCWDNRCCGLVFECERSIF